jgi:hypothetical protein
MHVGRISHPANTPHGTPAVAPSAVKPNTKMFTLSGLQDIPEPRTLRANEIPAVIREFRHAAAAARRSGAEGIEIHGASGGYLIHQFLSDNANLRTDLSFTPTSPWIPGIYHIRVGSSLEDVCGNSISGAFERSFRKHPHRVTEISGHSFDLLSDLIAPFKLQVVNIVPKCG